MAIKKQITPQSSNALQPLSSNATWIDVLNGAHLLMFEPANDKWRMRFILALYVWAEDPESLELEQFYWKMKLRRELVYDWREKYPEIKNAINDVKIFLGARKRVGAIKKIYDRDSAYRDMHKLDPEWDEINRYHAQLKSIQAAIDEIRVIALPAAPVTGKVTPRIRHGEVKEEDGSEG